MGLTFEVGASSPGGGRRGSLDLAHGVVETPVFMPVGTAATVKTVQQDTLEQIGRSGAGAEIILANTYHLYLRPGHELIRRMGGVHRFMSWSRPMLTDSGGFQVFSLAKLRKVTGDGVEFRSHLDGSKHFFSPEHSMEVQIALGADIMMVFDECVETPASWERTSQSMGLTHAWAARSKQYFEAHKNETPWMGELDGRTQSLFGIVQGGMYADLRRESAERLVEMDFGGYAIGGLAVGEPREVTREMGVDMMDCVLPTRAARHGLLFRAAEPGEADGGAVRMNIKRLEYAEDQRPVDAACGCMVCRRYTRAYLRHLFMAREPLGATLNSIHNLAFYLDIMERVRGELAGFRC